MKILHVIPGLTRERGGPTTVLQALVRYQAEMGHQVTVLTTDQGARHGEEPVEIPSAVSLDRLRVSGPDRLAFAPTFPAAVRGRLRNCEVVHVHSIFTYPVHVTLREAGALGVPLVLRPCGQLHRYSLQQSRWRKWVYLSLWGCMVRRGCTVWHYTSEQEAANSWPWNDGPRFVLPNGIDPTEFALDCQSARQIVQRRWPQLGSGPYVLFLGRLHVKKRLELLVQAFLAGAPSSFKLVVAGPDEGGIWNGLAGRWLGNSAASARVVRIGMVAGSEKAALLSAASLFALPSEHENFGVAALEALAAGTRVLLSPHVDLASAMLAEGLGDVAPLDFEAWRQKLSLILTTEPPWEKAAAIAKHWVKENYGWRRLVDDLVRHYHWAMNGCPAELSIGPSSSV